MRLALLEPDRLLFDSGRRVEPLLLLAFPFAVLAFASIMSGNFSTLRVVGSLVLMSAAALCATKGVKRTRLEWCPSSQRLRESGRVVTLSPSAQLVFQRTDASRPEAVKSPYEVVLLDLREVRVVLLRSSLSNVLNDLRAMRSHWPSPVACRVESTPSLETLLQSESNSSSCINAIDLQLASPALSRQFEIAGILGAVACVAAVVVGALVSGQLERHGVFTGLGLALGAFLIAVPVSIATHVALGRVSLIVDSKWVQVKRRRGLFGTVVQAIPRHELGGSWLVRTDSPARCDLLLLHRGRFASVPIACSASDTWALGLSESLI